MKINLRPAVSDDVKELLNIYKPYVEETAISFEYDVPSEEEFTRRMQTILAQYPYLVAEQGGKILGYAYASPFKPRAAYGWSVETTVYVDQKAKRMGIGTMLYEKLEEVLKCQGILNMNACIALPKQESAELTFDSVRFHEKMGFSHVGHFHDCGYKGGKWYDMIWMEKIIGDHKEQQTPPLPFTSNIF